MFEKCASSSFVLAHGRLPGKTGRMRFLEKKETELLDEKQLEALWPVLCSNSVLPESSSEKRVRAGLAALHSDLTPPARVCRVVVAVCEQISYDGFRTVCRALPSAHANYFRGAAAVAVARPWLLS
jgi:hypothetical protein